MQSALDLLSAAAFAQFELAVNTQPTTSTHAEPETPASVDAERQEPPSEAEHGAEGQANGVAPPSPLEHAPPTPVADTKVDTPEQDVVGEGDRSYSQRDEDAAALLGAFASSHAGSTLAPLSATDVQAAALAALTGLPPLQAQMQSELASEAVSSAREATKEANIQSSLVDSSAMLIDPVEDDADRTDSDDGAATRPSNQVAGVKRPRDDGDEGDVREPLPAFSKEHTPAAPSLGSFLPPLPGTGTVHLAFSSLPPIPTAFASTALPSLPTSFLPPLPSISKLAPPAIPSAPTSRQRPTSIPHLVPEDAGVIRCVCPYVSDDGFTIQCDFCNVWQHAHCVVISPEDVPDEYLCELCDPDGAKQRGVDPRKAAEAQKRRMELEAMRGTDSSDDMTMRRTGSIGLGAVRPKQKRAVSGAGTAASTAADERVIPAPSAVQSGGAADQVKRRKAAAAPSRQSSATSRSRGGSINVTSSLATSTAPPATSTTASATEASALLASAPVSDDEDDGEAYEVWQYEFTAVDENLWRDRELVSRLTPLLQQPPPEKPPTGYDTAVPLCLDSLPTTSPPLAVRLVPFTSLHLVPPLASAYASNSNTGPQCPYPRSNVHALYAQANIPAETFISPVRGRIISLATYRSDPLNQYSTLGVPKQGVRVLPFPWSLAIDQRLFGNEVRFARSGCHPNAVIRVIQLPTPESSPPGAVPEDVSTKSLPQWREQRTSSEMPNLAFALYATADISKRDEIILPWDWDDSHIVHALPALMSAPPLPACLTPPDLEHFSRKMAAVTTTLLGTTHCACEKKRDCAVFWMCRAASAAAPMTRAQSVKREPFATVLMNALGGGAKEETGVRGGKARKQKKPDVGPLLGMERGWVPRLDPPQSLPSRQVDEKEVEEKENVTLDEGISMDVDKEEKVASVAAVSEAQERKKEGETHEMDVDSPAVELPATKRRKSISVVKRVVEPAPPPPKPVDGNETDDSDLTEPLSHASDDERDAPTPIAAAPTPAASKSEPESKAEEEEEEEVVRPPARKRLVGSGKRSIKDVGPSRKKAKERESAIEKEKEKLRRLKALSKGKERAVDSDESVNKSTRDKDDSSKTVKPVEKKKKVVVIKKVAVTGDRAPEPSSKGKRPSSIKSVASKAVTDPPPDPSRSPSPARATGSSSTAPPVDSLAAQLFDEPAETAPPSSTAVEAPASTGPPRKLTLADLKIKRLPKPDPAPSPATEMSVQAAAPTKEPSPVVSEAVPEPEPEPEPVKPAPRARLSLAAYRQRQQAQKESEPVPEPPSTAPVSNVAALFTSSTVPTPPSFSRVASPAPSEASHHSSLNVHSTAPPQAVEPTSFSSAEDVLKRLGDYFSNSTAAAPVSAPAPPRPNGPMSYTRPIPPRQSSTPPRPQSPELSKLRQDTRSPVYQPTFDFPSRAQAQNAPAPGPIAAKPIIKPLPAAYTRPNTLGLAMGDEPSREKPAPRPPPPPMRYDYPGPEPVSPALVSAKLYSPPMPPTHPRGSTGPSPTLSATDLGTPASYTRPSPLVRPYDPDRMVDVPTGPRSLGSPGTPPIRGFGGRGGYGGRPLPPTAGDEASSAAQASFASGANSTFGTPSGSGVPGRGGRGSYGSPMPTITPGGASRGGWAQSSSSNGHYGGRGGPAGRARYDGLPPELRAASCSLLSIMQRDEFLTFLLPNGARTSALPADLVLLITDTLEAPATFLLTNFVGRAVRDGRKTLLLGSTGCGVEHYATIMKKNGVQLAAAKDKGLFTYLDASAGQPDILKTVSHELETLLPAHRGAVVVLDDVSSLLWAGVPIDDLVRFIDGLRRWASSNGGSLVVLLHADDLSSTMTNAEDTVLYRRILQRSDFWLETISLSSQIRGELSIHRGPALIDDYGVMERSGKSALQYKLEEAGPAFFIKGLGKEFF